MENKTREAGHRTPARSTTRMQNTPARSTTQTPENGAAEAVAGIEKDETD